MADSWLNQWNESKQMQDEAVIAADRQPKPVSRKDQSPSPDRVNVLLIEDNPGDARLIQLMLEDAGRGLFRLESVESLRAALERLKRGDIGLVLSDLTLPDSHGLDTFTQLYAHARQVPIIVLSGLNDTTLAVQAVHEGAQDFLIKGQVSGELLARAMHYAIERKKMSEQLAHFAEELRTRNAQLQADFNMAREIQQVFMPQQYPAFPHSASPKESSLRFSHRYIPAAEVGGDFFTAFPITDSAAGVFICDVMGHGMRAALITAIMRGLLEELTPVAADPGKFLSEINHSLHAILRRTREPFLATAFYMVADAAAAELRFANAGHPSPLHLREVERKVEPLKLIDPRHGPALGLFEESLYPNCRSALAQGDRILLFTDGLYEATNSLQEEFGHERLLKTVRKMNDLPTEKLLDGLVAEVQRFSDSREFEDDVCLMAVDVARVRG